MHSRLLLRATARTEQAPRCPDSSTAPPRSGTESRRVSARVRCWVEPTGQGVVDGLCSFLEFASRWHVTCCVAGNGDRASNGSRSLLDELANEPRDQAPDDTTSAQIHAFLAVAMAKHREGRLTEAEQM